MKREHIGVLLLIVVAIALWGYILIDYSGEQQAIFPWLQPKDHESPDRSPKTYVYIPQIQVDVAVSEKSWIRSQITDLPILRYIVVCRVWNTGNASAKNVQVDFSMDGQTITSNSIARLTSGSYQTFEKASQADYDEIDHIHVSAVCTQSGDGKTVIVPATLPRSPPPEIMPLYITPNEDTLMQVYNSYIKDKWPKWMACRNWVANNIVYVNDQTTGKRDYWKLPKETIVSRKGDCEDHAILLCTLLRIAGYSQDRVYVVLGTSPDEKGHAWVRCKLDVIGWWSFESVAEGFIEELWGDVSLRNYSKTWEFNDSTSHTLR